MRIHLLGLATAALLSGTIAASAQGYPAGGASGDQNQPKHAQPAGQQPQPSGRPSEEPGMSQGMRQNQGMRPDQGAPAGENRGYEHTQLQGTPRSEERNEPQGGQMLRGGEVREQGATHHLTVQERTNLRETVFRSGPRVTNVNFRIGVGAVVPRSVRLVTVPQPILAIYPAWAGDLYFVYGDEIVVVAPDSMEIVGVLPL